MKTMIIYVSLIFIALNIAWASNDENINLNQPLMSLDDIITGIRSRPELLKSVHVNFTHEIFALHAPDPVNTKITLHGLPLYAIMEFDLKRHGNKIYSSRKTFENLDVNLMYKFEEFSWDGKKEMGYARKVADPNQINPRRPLGHIQPRKSGTFQFLRWMTYIEQEVLDIPKPLSEILDECQWSLSGPVQVGEYTTYLLESKGLLDNVAKLKVWIDPTHDFAAAKIHLALDIENRKAIWQTLDDIKLEERDGVWVMTKATIKGVNENIDDEKENRVHYERFTAKEFQVGIEIPEDTFQVKFPKGTGIYDGITKRSYIVGEGAYPTKTPSLKYGPLPKFDGIKSDFSAKHAKGKSVLICYWDKDQRSSRHCIQELAKRKEDLKNKGIFVVGVHASNVDESILKKWLTENKVGFPVGTIKGDVEETLFKWGVKSLPWLILTDAEHTVRAEGFGVAELEEKLRGKEL